MNLRELHDLALSTKGLIWSPLIDRSPSLRIVNPVYLFRLKKLLKSVKALFSTLFLKRLITSRTEFCFKLKTKVSKDLKSKLQSDKSKYFKKVFFFKDSAIAMHPVSNMGFPQSVKMVSFKHLGESQRL